MGLRRASLQISGILRKTHVVRHHASFCPENGETGVVTDRVPVTVRMGDDGLGGHREGSVRVGR
jgi:hypothetical protein